ncbi:hypothetical protein B0T19DRAFT_135522 [Cercophora scortea]|uniref:Uncharacterized protein n=1 Tax=Cercophora scortea TaxID=314031 RepID=A0AAE0IYN5_9PEZI|nr:hypothetical protein B0T19DRAFT_135522 [Cercophora scortea]
MPASTSPKGKKAAMAGKNNKTEGQLDMTCKVFVYIDPTMKRVCNEAFATLARSGLPTSQGKWQIEVPPPPKPKPASLSEKESEESFSSSAKTFAPLSLRLKHMPKKGFLIFGKPRNPKDNHDNYEDVFGALELMMKEASFKKQIGLENSDVVTWSLSATPYSPNLSRWVLPAPRSPVKQPGEKIEHVLYNLCRLKIRRTDYSHGVCGGMAVMECIENQLYKQKQLYLGLAAQQAHFATLNGMQPDDRDKVIKESITAMEAIDKALNTLIHLFEEQVGRILPPPPMPTSTSTRWNLTRALKNLLKNKTRYGTVHIDDKTIENLKKEARRELEGLQRIAPLVAAHLRLASPATWKQLKRACDAATEGPERREMPEKMGLAPATLGNPAAHAAALKRVEGIYEESYNKVIAQVEALNKILGSEYVKRGEKLFRQQDGNGDVIVLSWRKRLRKTLGMKRGAGVNTGQASKRCLVEEKAGAGAGWRGHREFDEKC